MVKCLLCGREFKNGSGLSGHMRFSHPSALPVDSNKLEARLEAVEASIRGVRAIVREIVPALQSMAAGVAELRKVVNALLAVHYLEGSQIDIETLPENVKTMLKSALSTPETEGLRELSGRYQKALGK